MATLVQMKPSRFASFKANVSPSRPHVIPARGPSVREPRAFPGASTRPIPPPIMHDEMIALYAFTFCQRGFRQLEMTFEQFLLVAAVIRPDDLGPAESEA